MGATLAPIQHIQEISSIEQLRALGRWLGIALLIGPAPRFQFAISHLPAVTNREANQRMANYQSACGCFAGGLTMGLSALTFIVVYFVSGRSLVGGGLKGVALFFALLLGSSLAGKALGLLWARIRMVQLIRTMAARAEHELIDAPA